MQEHNWADVYRSPKHGEMTRSKVRAAIESNPAITVQELAEVVGISVVQVKRHVERLRWEK